MKLWKKKTPTPNPIAVAIGDLAYEVQQHRDIMQSIMYTIREIEIAIQEAKK